MTCILWPIIHNLSLKTYHLFYNYEAFWLPITYNLLPIFLLWSFLILIIACQKSKKMFSDTFNLSFPKFFVGNPVIKYILWFPAFAGTTSVFPLKDCGNDDLFNFQYLAFFDLLPITYNLPPIFLLWTFLILIIACQRSR